MTRDVNIIISVLLYLARLLKKNVLRHMVACELDLNRAIKKMPVM